MNRNVGQGAGCKETVAGGGRGKERDYALQALFLYSILL